MINVKFTKCRLQEIVLSNCDLLVCGVFENDFYNGVPILSNFAGGLDDLYITNRLILIGLGDKNRINNDLYRRFGGLIFKNIVNKNVGRIGIYSPLDFSIKSVCEGIKLAQYKFDKYLTQNENFKALDFVFFIQSLNFEGEISLANTISKAVFISRSMVNEGPSVLKPEKICNLVKKAIRNTSLDMQVFNEQFLFENKFGLFLAVAQGSLISIPPRLIKLQYKPKTNSTKHVVLIGKGVTFDSGGLNIKNSDSMLHMKTDMAGAAAVLSVMKAIEELKAKVTVTGYMACVENSVSPTAYCPGDVLISRKGLTIEVVNTDAEGRLILADVINFAQEFDRPDVIIDIATLTGACSIALGLESAGLFSNSDKLSAKIIRASMASAERVWRLPLDLELHNDLKSSIADLKNCGGRYGGAITAALFLEKFINPGILWAHLDIAGPAKNDKDHSYIPVGGTGFIVRTLIELILSY